MENSGERDALLQILLKLNGEDQSAVAEFLASIANLNFSASEEEDSDKVAPIYSREFYLKDL